MSRNRMLLSLVTLSVVVSLLHAKEVPYCNAPADIVFILDSSNSIWRPNFTKQLNFVTKLVKKFDIGQAPTQTRIGLLTFGHKVWKKFDLRDKIDESEVIQAVKAINHDRGRTTNTADAIEFAMKQMFTPVAGSRKGVAQIAVVITDGRSQETRRTSKAARNAQDSGIMMFAIGVGKNVDRKELSDIASDPDDDHMFMVDDSNALSTILEMLAAKTCRGCEDDQHQCGNGACIPSSFVCDGKYDCSLGEDELDCLTTALNCNTTKEFDCWKSVSEWNDFKTCIPRTWVCDGWPDCLNDEDEENCTTKPLPEPPGGNPSTVKTTAAPSSINTGQPEGASLSLESVMKSLESLDFTDEINSLFDDLIQMESSRSSDNEDSARSCSVAQVWCDDGKQSVSVFKWGDGVCDCLDGSDESQCG